MSVYQRYWIDPKGKIIPVGDSDQHETVIWKLLGLNKDMKKYGTNMAVKDKDWLHLTMDRSVHGWAATSKRLNKHAKDRLWDWAKDVTSHDVQYRDFYLKVFELDTPHRTNTNIQFNEPTWQGTLQDILAGKIFESSFQDFIERVNEEL